VKLYVKRVFIMDDAEALMPSYLRFVKGVIDSADLPLNVSRELLQESRDVKAIREGSTKRVLGMLEDLAKKQKTAPESGEGKIDVGSGESVPAPEPTEAVTDVVDKNAPTAAEAAAAHADESGKYARFYAEFGAVLKEGLGEDMGNRDRIAKLLRYASTTTDAVSVSFADYKARMKEGQDAIYYITADTLAGAKNSPQLEVFKKKGIEVLLMTDRVDEWALNYLNEFDGTPLQSVAKGAVDLGKLQDDDEKKAAEEAAESFKPLLEKLKEALKDKADDVRVTTRLVDSPACLVVQDGGMSTQLARMLKQAGQPAPEAEAGARGERRAPAGEEARRLRALRRPGEHPVRPGAAGRRRPAGRSRGLREARQRAAGVTPRPRVVRSAALASAGALLLMAGGCSHYHIGIRWCPGFRWGSAPPGMAIFPSG
jgi:molecular chaperone HtpG